MENLRAARYVALLPAAGTGSRLPGRRLSKELLRYGDAHGRGRPAMSHLLESLRIAGVHDVVVVLREGKRDIEDFLAGDEWQPMRFSCTATPGTSGVPETVALGLQGIDASNVVFGFPDILFEPRDAFVRLIRRLETSAADAVLGLFPTDTPEKMDMVGAGENGRVTDIEIKPARTGLTLTWILAVWKPAFSSYLLTLVHDEPDRLREQAREHDGSHLGHAFQLALADGLLIESESFVEGRSLDIGTPDDLALARHWKY